MKRSKLWGMVAALSFGLALVTACSPGSENTSEEDIPQEVQSTPPSYAEQGGSGVPKEAQEAMENARQGQ